MKNKCANVVVNSPVIDKIAYILPWGKNLSEFSLNEKEIPNAVRNLDAQIDAKKCQKAYTSKSRYKKSFKILLSNNEHAFVQFGSVDSIRQKGGIRVEFNPAKIHPNDINTIHSVMSKIFGEDEYQFLLRMPLLQVLHIAVDVNNIKLDDIIIEYKNSHRTTMFCKRYDNFGHIEGYNFGSVSSDYQAAAYDKRQEVIHASLLKLINSGASGFGGDDLKDNKINQFFDKYNSEPRIRIEIRGRKLRGIDPKKLKHQENRFNRFRFIDVSDESKKNAIPDYLHQCFLALCRQYNIKYALELFKNTDYRRKILKFYKNNEVEWWNPDEIWKDSIKNLKSLNIFPKSVWKRNK